MPKKFYGLLQGKKGVIFGPLNESSLAWQIALQIFAEGGRFVLTNAPIALRFGKIKELSTACDNAPVIPADAMKDDDMEKLFNAAQEQFGGIDFIVHSVGRSENIQKKVPYDQLRYDFYFRTLNISAISLHRAIHFALPCLNTGASIVSLSYIGAQRVFSEYNDMGDAKALLESITRSFGAVLGKRGIRVNTVSQSPTKTTAGKGISGFNAMYELADQLAPLGNANAEECAEYIVTLLSDLTRKVTMQNLYHDGGFSHMGMNDTLMETLVKSLGGNSEKESTKAH
ncbi:enoyl-ACP reductase [candidate division KSB3 bacterium]|uniref:Enoyl-[acyl-carrier-protein] reductase [NADH] n=1 Tax=candidate division KSB3 bacterium TaxID=2044937 RepID=A0A2G6E0Z5_9BACT|nr:MAG: enoyl-ACP reductase [candidate division KSB3 bacterium]PIE28428.1 MAG: enoyl-ACP reductase [candidate division KSB3 bacterium]